MKNFLLVMVGLALSLALSAQTTTNLAFEFPSLEEEYADKVRIHIIVRGVLSYRLQTTLQEESLKVKRHEHTIIVADTEQIGFFSNSVVNNLPVLLSFDRGQDYYFRITFNPNDFASHRWEITEMTERAFQMQLFANNISPVPVIYDYTIEKPIE